MPPVWDRTGDHPIPNPIALTTEVSRLKPLSYPGFCELYRKIGVYAGALCAKLCQMLSKYQVQQLWFQKINLTIY